VIRAIAVAAAISLLPAATAGSAVAQAPRASLPDVEDEVMCTICGTLLEESQSPQADRERALIRDLIAQGKDKDQIKDALVAEYGPRVLATPSGHGFDLVAWIVPGLGILLVLGGLVWFALRRRAPSPPGQPIEPGDASLLDRDMSRYDL
jgi:cytochrome c-type biogenesis protein CcmH